MNIAYKIVGMMLGMFVLGLGSAEFKALGALTPVDLRCGLRVNPLGIGDANPRLSWQLETGGQRGEVQSAYEIQVGSVAGGADLWDSGKVESGQTVDVLYGGQPLESGERCYWQVRVYDGSNDVSGWSESAQWTMGLLRPTDWTAEWIGYDAAYNLTPGEATNVALFNTSGLSWIGYSGQTAQGNVSQSSLLKQVIMPTGQAITNAVMAMYANNYCSLFVNGQEMTNSAMTSDHPGAAAARWEATAWINVTAWLHGGTNVLALAATNNDTQQSATVIGRLVVQFASGSVSNIPVDTTWVAAQWPTGNWTQTNYNDSGWATPASGGTPWGTPSLNDIARVPVPYLRKEFGVNQTVTRATVYVTALGAYELHLNGQKVGNDVLTPGWTDFAKRVYYQTYDVTGMVEPGTNTLGAILGDGWYASVLAYTGQRQYYGGTPRFLAQLVMQLSDGSTQTVVSDGSWKASYGPIQWGDLLLGSEYDARLELPGWDTTNFNDSGWSPVATGLSTTTSGYTNVTELVTSLVTNNQLNFVANNAAMGGDPALDIPKTLEINFTLGGTNLMLSYPENATVQIGSGGQTLIVNQALYGNLDALPGTNGVQVQAAVTEPSRCLQVIAATNLTEPSPGGYIFDLGQNMVGWVQLNISGHIGDRITVRHGELLNPDGTIYTDNLRGASATDFYIFGTNGTVTYQPRFTFHGFRYVEVMGLTVPPTLNSVTGMVVHSDITSAGTFACSSSLVNQLYSNIIWSHKANYLEVATDCPQRDERMGYTGDTEFFLPTAVYNFDVQSFFRRWLVTLCEDSQNLNGSYPDVAPYVSASSQSGAAGWEDAGWICPYIMYETYGDTNNINDHYASMAKFGQWLDSQASGYVITSLPNDLGDWLNVGGGASEPVIDTAYYAYYAEAMSEMAAAIGNTADALTYSTLHSNIVTAFANFFNPDGSFADGSGQTGYALAFTLNLVPGNLRTAAARQLASNIVGNGNHLSTGFIGTPRLLPALHAAGRDDLAYSLLLQDTYPSWLYPVTLGSTTIWETWNGSLTASFNHYTFGSVGQYLYSAVGGINPASPGYQTILIQPVPETGLTWANTSYNSTRGLISTAWTNSGGTLNLSTVIPPNTTAEIEVPTTNASAITESGVPAASSPGVSYVGVSNGYAIYDVGSGTYFWSSPFTIPVLPGVIIAATNQLGSGSGTFTPDWNVETNGDLIAGQSPTTMVGNFSEEAPGRSVYALTTRNSLALTQIAGTLGNTTSTNYVTCGNGSGAGSQLVYSLTNASYGYNLTNITVYGGWKDAGRDQQAYTVYYSTVSAPTTFYQIGIVNYLPSNPLSVPCATLVALTSSVGVLASNVAAVMFDFTSPASENGYCGYAAITLFGTPSVSPPSGPVITVSNEQAMTPTWVVESPNLIGGQEPGSYTGNPALSVGGPNGNVINLTDGLLGLGSDFASCGGDGVSCSSLTYTCTNGSWNITNVAVYTGWTDYGRDGQFFNLSYSTLSAPATFLPLASVDYNPNVPAGVTSANRVDIAPPLGQTMLASNVAAVNFDFTPQGIQDYGWSAYTEIVFQGVGTVPLVVPRIQTFYISGGNLILTGTNGTPHSGYTWLVTTNLAAPVIWTTNVTGTLDNAGAFSNSIPIKFIQPDSFFRLRMP